LPLKEILKVLYAPQKAFKEIIQNPKIFGPIVVMMLFIVAYIGANYIILTKTYAEQTLPTSTQKDIWTENANYWSVVGGSSKENSLDYVTGDIHGLYGNKSIEFSVKNSTAIAMQLENIGSINCSNSDGYTKLYFRVKWISPENKPENAAIYLYSGDSSKYFYHGLAEEISNYTVNIWNNLTVSLADERWSSNGTANWENITGLKIELLWTEKSNITVLVDGLFFGGVFKPTENMIAAVSQFAIIGFMQFVFRWVLLAGIIYVMTRAFRANTVWRMIIILIGFTLITMFIQTVINAVAFSTLPNLKYSFEYLGGVAGEREAAYQKIVEEAWLVNQIYSYVQAAVIVWTVALCALAVRSVAEFPLSKSLLVAVVAYFAATTIEGFLIGV